MLALVKSNSVPKELMEEFEGFKCLACERVFKDFEKMEKELLFIEQCSHIFCKECLTEHINLSYPDVKCLADGCESHLKDFEVRSVIGEAAFFKLEEELITKALKGNATRCKCGNLIELV
jgi:hypothetical protein